MARVSIISILLLVIFGCTCQSYHLFTHNRLVLKSQTNLGFRSHSPNVCNINKMATDDEMELSPEEQKRRDDEQTQRSKELIQEYYRTVPKLVTIDSLSSQNIPWRRNVKIIQKKLPDSKPLTAEERAAIKMSQKEEFQKEKYALLVDNLFLCSLGFAFCWSFFPLSAALSYGLGSLFGIFYLTLLARFVENLGEGGIDTSGGSSRLALVILLVLLGGKYKEYIQIPPSLAGFFTFQITTLLRGLLPTETSLEDERF